MDSLLLILFSILTSSITAIFGLGGGILLLSVMPGFIPNSALIPVHGLVQLASNSTRVVFGRSDLQSLPVRHYLVGAVFAFPVGVLLLSNFKFDHLPLLLGTFIIVVTWVPIPAWSLGKQPFIPLGFLCTVLSLFVGSAGPLSAPFLQKLNYKRDEVVVTHAAHMVVLHSFKVVAFGVLGLLTLQYLPLILGMIGGVTLGSWIGTRLRGRVKEGHFQLVFKWLVTALALRMLVIYLWFP